MILSALDEFSAASRGRGGLGQVVRRLRWAMSRFDWRSNRGPNRRPNRRLFADSLVDAWFLNSHFFRESFNRVLAVQSFHFNRSVLIQELINWEITSANSDLNVVLFNLDRNSLSSKLINAFGLSHEHDLKLLPLRVIIDKFRKSPVYLVILDRYVDCNSVLQIDDVLFKRFKLVLGILQLF